MEAPFMHNITKANLIFFVAMTLSTGSITAMQKTPQAVIDFKQTIAIGEEHITSLVKQQLSSQEKIYHHFKMPKEGAFFKISDESCYPSQINIEIEKGTQYISLFRDGPDKIKITNDANKLLAEFSIFRHAQK
jgi:hypothetical protein